MFKPPKSVLNETVEYLEYKGTDRYNEPSYAEPVMIEHVRIDRTSNYTSGTGGETLLWNAIVFCFVGVSTNLPQMLKEKSIVRFDGKDHIINKVATTKEPYANATYSFELEVI
ncbi:minor capsid protein [Aerococcus viridans]|uniref:minor capsid protein n=1 Tax=Aerococcus viridans TaxID=1377 RepID=UPI00223BD30C|nr:minor capsid protein [Aerococcus viridans]MCT1798475.1 minor capsid protein [Aerococcus viridans]